MAGTGGGTGGACLVSSASESLPEVSLFGAGLGVRFLGAGLGAAFAGLRDGFFGAGGADGLAGGFFCRRKIHGESIRRRPEYIRCDIHPHRSPVFTCLLSNQTHTQKRAHLLHASHLWFWWWHRWRALFGAFLFLLELYNGNTIIKLAHKHQHCKGFSHDSFGARDRRWGRRRGLRWSLLWTRLRASHISDKASHGSASIIGDDNQRSNLAGFIIRNRFSPRGWLHIAMHKWQTNKK